MNYPMKINNLVISIAISVISIATPYKLALANQSLDRIVAIVNSDVISQSELDGHTRLVAADMRQQAGTELPRDVLQRQVLNRMIIDKIQLQMAEQVGIEVDSIAVSQAMHDMARQNGQTLEDFKISTQARGIDFNSYRETIRTDMITQTLQSREVGQEINVSKNDIESFLNSPAGQDQSGTEYRISHILIATSESPSPEALKRAQSEAQDIVTKLKSGDEFQKIAMTKSAGRQALKGGDLGWRTTGELPTLFVSYVPTMQVGDIAGPIRSASGFHIIKLQEKRVSAEESRTETHVRQIFVKTDANTSNEEAKAALHALQQKIKKGANFAKLAAQKSQEARTAEKGGDMGWVNEKIVLPKFYQVMTKLRNNEVSEPFQTDEGWHLIQVLARRTQRSSDEAAWNKAREVLTMRKANEVLEAWTKRIRDDAQVEILLADENLNGKNI